MNIKSTLLAAALASLGACIAAPALAQSTANASLGALTYRLIDLDPYDGITPWISLTSTDAFGNGLLNEPTVPDQIPHEAGRFDLFTFGTVGFDTAYGNAHMRLAPDTISSSIEAINGQGFVNANHLFSFTLSPHTQVVFSSAADLSGAFDPGVGLSESLVSLSGGSTDVPGFLSFGSSYRINGGDVHTLLSAAANNTFANPLTGFVALEADVSAQAVSPVPEPAPAGMLAGGLLLVGGLLRRRSARR